ncbi:uncharacterized protein LOC112555661 isoform X2 [Pomacea canaliculata]|nr:uncharacterized protein LOC112555661 isoform X2 [Pomacea canaliculata]
MTVEMFAGHVVRVFAAPHGQAEPSGVPHPPPAAPRRATPKVLDSDVRDDAAMQRVLTCLARMSRSSGEVLMGVSQLQFEHYLGEEMYALASEQLPRPCRWQRGDFDVLLIHRHHGFVVFEVKAIGYNVRQLDMSEEQLYTQVRKKLKQAAYQLNKAKAFLSHVVSDVVSGLRVSVAMAFPYIRAAQVENAIAADQEGLAQKLSECLGTSPDPSDIASMCLCSEHLSDPTYDLSDEGLTKLRDWWKRGVEKTGPDPKMTSHLYKILLARFCGPATTVTVPCVSSPRKSLKTLGPAVSIIGDCFHEIALFPEQVDLLKTAPSRLILAGPPGTGKSVMLLLIAARWLLGGKDVCILSSWSYSRAASIMLRNLLQKTLTAKQESATQVGQLHLVEIELINGRDAGKALRDIVRRARGGEIYIIADEGGPDELPWGNYFKTFCEKMLARCPGLHLWAASCLQGTVPTGWQVEHLTRPLRCPPAVVQEIEQANQMTSQPHRPPLVRAYTSRGYPITRRVQL